jgi:hypothetical protein
LRQRLDIVDVDSGPGFPVIGERMQERSLDHERAARGVYTCQLCPRSIQKLKSPREDWI